MKSILLAVLLLTAFKENPVQESRLSAPNAMAASPRFTTDAQHNPILTWTEKTGDSVRFYLARSTDGGRTFATKQRIPAPSNLSTHAEGMPKIAVAGNGTLLALFEVPHPTPDSRFAGDLLYTRSTDGGQTWSQPKPVHRDVRSGKSHSFSDLTLLPNGEIGIVWLDEKLPSKEGRPVKFVQTLPGGGFSAEVIVDSNACQCCRTNVFVDRKNQIHLTWRDLLPNLTPGQPASRDISHAVSADGGWTFSQPAVWMADHWQVNACPHAGPSVATTGDGLVAAWFSGKEGNAGLRLAQLGTTQPIATVPTNRAKHPQVANLGNRLVWVWDQTFVSETTGTDGFSITGQQIHLQTIDGQSVGPIQTLTKTGLQGANPVLWAGTNGWLVAWEERNSPTANAVIVCRWIENL